MAKTDDRQLSNIEIRGIPRRVYLIGIFVYALVLGVVMFLRGGFIGPDTFLIFIVLLVVVLGQTRTFLIDWTPFVILFFGWQMLRGYADNVGAGYGFPLHNEDLVAAERWLFGGHLPNVVLQRALNYNPQVVRWYDALATFFWAFHFVLALGFAFLLWVRSRSLYWRFVYALLLLSTLGIITYVVYPAVPPWMASNPPEWLANRVEKTIPENIYLLRAWVPYQLGLGSNWSWIMANGNPNETAAMPSLHAAYPTLIFVFSLIYWRKAAPFALLYCLGLWFSIVYMGDHYVIDVLAGIVYAVVAFFALEGLYKWLARRRAARISRAFVVEEAS
ncbi:MAG: phosphatase PAP2 family protein [Chloroflexota bacterium]|nr:phosphatase PAP2 family protein [Chloroflexota bacterium]